MVTNGPFLGASDLKLWKHPQREYLIFLKEKGFIWCPFPSILFLRLSLLASTRSLERWLRVDRVPLL